jgi:ATP-dependent exoDNAse (exonuclease V) alpha subunit
LWNAVEKIEKAKNAQLAREIELALPAELTREQNISLARDYVKEHFVSAGMCADICVHDKNDGNVNEYERSSYSSSTRLRSNPHAHIMLTLRPILDNGEWGDKQKKEYILDGRGEKIYDPKKKQYKCKSIPTTDWNDQTKAEEWRAAWAQSVNADLRRSQLWSV